MFLLSLDEITPRASNNSQNHLVLLLVFLFLHYFLLCLAIVLLKREAKMKATAASCSFYSQPDL